MKKLYIMTITMLAMSSFAGLMALPTKSGSGTKTTVTDTGTTLSNVDRGTTVSNTDVTMQYFKNNTTYPIYIRYVVGIVHTNDMYSVNNGYKTYSYPKDSSLKVDAGETDHIDILTDIFNPLCENCYARIDNIWIQIADNEARSIKDFNNKITCWKSDDPSKEETYKPIALSKKTIRIEFDGTNEFIYADSQ